MNIQVPAIEIDSIEDTNRLRYSICTFVTNKSLYQEMVESFLNAGFANEFCEYLYIDNSNDNKYDAFQGINKFINISRGEFIIFCHQDVVLHDHDVHHLNNIIDEMDAQHPDWALLGNAGGTVPGQFAIRITDPHYGKNTTIGNLPAKAAGLDENFILLKSSANLGASHDLEGFHLFGTDLCLLASIHGYSSYVVDFHLWHKGGESQVKDGVKPKFLTSFNEFRAKFLSKYQRIKSPAWTQTTCTLIYISGSKFKNSLFNRKHIYSLQKRIYKWFKT